MLYIGGMKTKYLFIGFVLMVGVVLILAMTGGLSYAMSRMDGWGQALIYTDEDMWQTTWQKKFTLRNRLGRLWDSDSDSHARNIFIFPNRRTTLFCNCC